MAKALRKQELKLKTRQQAYDLLPEQEKSARRRPGSQNRKKRISASVAKKRR